MSDMPSLADYREVITALDRADAAFRNGAIRLQDYQRLMVEHLENIRDAVENCLFRDHNKLGFTKQHAHPTPVPGGQHRKGPATKLSPEAVLAVRQSRCPLRIFAEEYGLSTSYLSKVRRGEVLQ